jgi:hypothetical protein
MCRLATGTPLTEAEVEAATIEGAVHRLRPKLMSVAVLLASLVPILGGTGIGSDVMKPIAAPIVGGMITSTAGVEAASKSIDSMPISMAPPYLCALWFTSGWTLIPSDACMDLPFLSPIGIVISDDRGERNEWTLHAH